MIAKKHNPNWKGWLAVYEKIKVSEGCWEWLGQHTSDGYGQIRHPVTGRMHNAHRLVYEMLFGVRPGSHINHVICQNRGCVNPVHLEEVTPRENTLRGKSPSAINARKTHCKNGHPFDTKNTRITPKGERACRACANEQVKRRYRKSHRAVRSVNHLAHLQVINIYHCRGEISPTELAKLYGCSDSTVHDIWRGRSYRYLTGA